MLRCNAEVAEILVENRRAVGVRLKDGERIAADIVVSNADSAWTYRHLIAPQHRRRWTDHRIERSRFSNGLFVWYFGTKRRYDDVPHHMIMLGPRYRELLTDIFKRKILAEDFSLYLHRPDRDRRLAGAAGLRCVLRAGAGSRISAVRSIGAWRPSPIARRSSAIWSKQCFQVCARRS